MYVCMYVCMYVYIYIYMYIYTYGVLHGDAARSARHNLFLGRGQIAPANGDRNAGGVM